MINSFWGIESPRPVGPLVEYVGPIINAVYDPLDSKLSKFMDTHQRVVYIAFGQMYNPSKKEFEVLLTSLVEAYESDYLNGFIWSLSMKSRHNLPEQIITRSGRVYKVNDLLQNHADLRFETWSPQFAILQHPHCRLFISHGGASSIHESLYNGVPLLLHPFTSDQPQNANSIVASGVALQVDRKKYNVTDTFEKLSEILLDKDQKFATQMKSMQALVQIRSRRKVYAADIIEEVLYSVRSGDDLWYRRQVNERMPWYKATNWDINMFGVCIIAFVFSGVYAVIRFVFVSHKKHKVE
ncbi:UDP-glucuronosyltransferase 2B37 [Choanephora cucurbitarum]|uniref:UDP-glucuronosyltransferase 2B37 n=1 Tax=Choanephora cucurbitarum TaxID=101091 RepID=A0A1C7NNR1_9FUNG|nr:UDP-glucuronosyltransferase 2B37 [Choanephora cucurbitarum]